MYPESLQCLDQVITIGSDRICPNCGHSADGLSSSNLSHYSCTAVETMDIDDLDDLDF